MKTLMLAGAALALLAGAPLAAHAQDTNYNGYCYAKKSDAKTTGTIVGAVIGGAVIGGAIGRSAGANSVKCYNGEYYSYKSGYYTPGPAPDGYDVVYYQQQPDSSAYNTVYYDRDRHTQVAYNNGYDNGYQAGAQNQNGRQGWRDDRGGWHTGRPVAFGWKDASGRWHEGQLAAYGWQDNRGSWHETSTAPSYGYNNSYDNSGYNGYNNNGY